MKNNSRLHWKTLLPLAALLGTACATTTPVELQNARNAYARANNGPAARETPADLHKAMMALQLAERTFSDEEGSQKTIDLAYIAERSAQLAEARAEAAIAMRKTSEAEAALAQKKDVNAAKTEDELAKTRIQLTDSQHGEALQSEKTANERAARDEADRKAVLSEQKAVLSDQKAIAAEQKLRVSDEALVKLAAKQETRGMVITLSGSVLFRSSDSALLPAAQKRLDDVADALVTDGRDVIIEGHTDARGSSSNNLSLSQRRADSVRSYLVSRGFPGDKILARGIGSDRPIAENTSSEGRANNRRVEIVVVQSQNTVN
jgi:outer membrane protein OmpA-like peptidoglycan-associated protein